MDSRRRILIDQGFFAPYLATGHTTTTGVLSVLANAAVASTDVATVFACLAKSGRHLDGVGVEDVVDSLQNVFLLLHSGVARGGEVARLI